MNLEDILLSKMCQSQKDKYCNTVCFHLWEIPRLVKFIELESRVVVTRGSGEEVEKGMAPHSSTPAWRIPWTKEPGGLQSLGSQRVRHHWSNSADRHSITDLSGDYPWFQGFQGEMDKYLADKAIRFQWPTISKRERSLGWFSFPRSLPQTRLLLFFGLDFECIHLTAVSRSPASVQTY